MNMALKILHSGSRKKGNETVTYEHGSGADIVQFGYGKFPIDYAVNFEGLTLSFDLENGMYHYKRALGDWKTDINVCVTGAKVLIHPVEPLNLPDNLTDFMEIKFNPIRIEPSGICVVFVTMPIEIGVFLESKEGPAEILDIVSYVYPKYSLYGGANRGVITRFNESKVYYYPPSVKNYEAGLLKLEIENKSDEWATVGRVVIFQKGLYLYFDENFVTASAEMKIISPDVAVVTGIDSPVRPGMTPSNRLFKTRKLTPFYNVTGMLNDASFTMDMGLI
jgi:hypothetical protein